MKKLSQIRLKEIISYNLHSGLFTWLDGRGPRWAGKQAGTIQKKGYVQIEIDSESFKAHRLAWFYVTDTWPDDQIDHIDGNRVNNAWANLRLATNKINAENKRSAQANNALGILGVGKKPDRGGYRARITIDGKSLNLGRFKTPAEAYARYVEAKRELHRGCLL